MHPTAPATTAAPSPWARSSTSASAVPRPTGARPPAGHRAAPPATPSPGLAAGRANLNHRPNPNFLRIGPRLTDHAAAFNFSPPFAVGTWDWVIPNKFRRAATTGAGTFFFNTLQTFRIDAAGSITVSKQGA